MTITYIIQRYITQANQYFSSCAGQLNQTLVQKNYIFSEILNLFGEFRNQVCGKIEKTRLRI
jgi:hypothetical protein